MWGHHLMLLGWCYDNIFIGHFFQWFLILFSQIPLACNLVKHLRQLMCHHFQATQTQISLANWLIMVNVLYHMREFVANG